MEIVGNANFKGPWRVLLRHGHAHLLCPGAKKPWEVLWPTKPKRFTFQTLIEDVYQSLLWASNFCPLIAPPLHSALRSYPQRHVRFPHGGREKVIYLSPNNCMSTYTQHGRAFPQRYFIFGHVYCGEFRNKNHRVPPANSLIPQVICWRKGSFLFYSDEDWSLEFVQMCMIFFFPLHRAFYFVF